MADKDTEESWVFSIFSLVDCIYWTLDVLPYISSFTLLDVARVE
jgi:hypothetical protein